MKFKMTREHGLMVFIAILLIALLTQPIWGIGTSQKFFQGGINDWQKDTHHFSGTFAGGSDTFTTTLQDVDFVQCFYDDSASATLVPLGDVVSAAAGTVKVYGDTGETYWAVAVDVKGQ